MLSKSYCNFSNELFKLYSTLICAALFSFYNILQLSSFNCLRESITISFGVSFEEYGLLSSFFLFANAIGLIPIGFLLDRISSRKVILFFIAIAIFATAILNSTHHYYIAILARCLQGFSSAASLLVSMRIGTLSFKKNSFFMVGLIIAIALSGGIVSNSIFSNLITHYGWHFSLNIDIIIGIIIFILSYLFFDSSNTTHKLTFTNFITSKIHILKEINYPFIIHCGFLFGLLNAPLYILGSLWGTYYLQNVTHINNTLASQLNSYIFIGVIFGSILFGYLNNYFINPIKTLKYSCILAMIISILFCYAQSPIIISILLFLLGILSSSQNCLFTLITRNNIPDITSTATAFANLIANLIGAFLQIIFSLLISINSTKLFFKTAITNNNHVGFFILSLIFLITYFISAKNNHIKNYLIKL